MDIDEMIIEAIDRALAWNLPDSAVPDAIGAQLVDRTEG